MRRDGSNLAMLTGGTLPTTGTPCLRTAVASAAPDSSGAGGRALIRQGQRIVWWGDRSAQVVVRQLRQVASRRPVRVRARAQCEAHQLPRLQRPYAQAAPTARRRATHP